MTTNAVLQVSLHALVLTALAIPIGRYMAAVYEGRAVRAQRLLGPIERFVYRVAGVRDEDMAWQTYCGALLVFNALGLLMLYSLQRLQGFLPLNGAGLPGVGVDVALNTAVSFASNTNWQTYGGETTMSTLTQMLGLTVQNFLSAATGMAVVVALIRGFTRRKAAGIGNFWIDLVRSTLYVLLPLSLVVALFLIAQGVPQTFEAKATAELLEPVAMGDGSTVTAQEIALGPVASQVAIKQLGTNGGGHYNVNSAHPLENPTPLSNFVEMLAILLLGGALCFALGELVKDRRQGVALYAAMSVIFLPLMLACLVAEQSGNPALTALGVDPAASALQSGGNMEGKEVRFGIASSALWAAATTAASNGSVNAMHDSFTPLGGLVPLWLMQFGEVVFGGVGSGLYGMLAYAIVAVFIGGLMIGRTPEYLGKKVEAFEMKMAALTILLPAAVILLGTALACLVPAGTATLGNPGVHGFSEILYAFTSGAANNGSAFGGLTASGRFWAVAIAVAMFFGRYWLIIPILAIAGSLAKKNVVPRSAGTLPTHGPLFVTLLAGTVVLVGALTFFPALALGPIVEHLQLQAR
ncbi:MAG: potassium-transporting ATPase subunit KdpA [Myxococcota bacterium]